VTAVYVKGKEEWLRRGRVGIYKKDIKLGQGVRPAPSFKQLSLDGRSSTNVGQLHLRLQGRSQRPP
jgi:hypothetical protein